MKVPFPAAIIGVSGDTSRDLALLEKWGITTTNDYLDAKSVICLAPPSADNEMYIYAQREALPIFSFTEIATSIKRAEAQKKIKDLERLSQQLGDPMNPKDAISIQKVSTALSSAYVEHLVALALMEGQKYGAHNYRAAKVRASVYYGAARRHMGQWIEGEEQNKETHVHHLAHAIANLQIILDAQLRGTLEDDRPPKLPDGWLESLSKRAAELHKERSSEFKSPFTQKGLQKSPG